MRAVKSQDRLRVRNDTINETVKLERKWHKSCPEEGLPGVAAD